MRVHVPTRVGWLAVLALALATAATATAEGRPGAPAPVEVYYGTTKVNPPPRTNIWEPRPETPAPEPNSGAEPRLLPASGTGIVGAPAPLAVPEPSEPKAPPAPQTVVVIREPLAPAPQPQPAVVVVREPAPTAEPAPAHPATDWVLAGALVVGLLFVAIAIASRRSAGTHTTILGSAAAPLAPPATAPVAPAAPPAPAVEPEPQTLKLTDGYDVGPPPNTTQKFDVGPSYQEERKVKQQQEELKGAAVLEFILGQNLALRDSLDAEPQAAPVAPTAPRIQPQPRPQAVVPDFLTGVLVPFPEPAQPFTTH